MAMKTGSFIERTKLEKANFGDSVVGKTLQHVVNEFDIGRNGYGVAILSRTEEGKNRLTYQSRSPRFAQILREEMMLSEGIALDRAQIDEIAEKLNGIAGIAKQASVTHLRVALTDCGNGRVFDVGDEEGTQYQLKDGKVSVITEGSEQLFISSNDAEALPSLTERGDWKKILPYLNMEKKHQFLFIAWLLHTMTLVREPDAAYPILVIYGGQGTGKSTFCKRIIRPLLDPRAAKIKSFPKKQEDLAISLQNEFASIYDNLRSLSKSWSDYLCIASTYGVEEKRKLYSDGDSVKFELHGSVVLNGIHDFIEEPDLASRSIYISMKQLTGEQRVNGKTMLQNLEADLPEIYTGLLELLAQILEVLPTVSLKKAGRLNEFSTFLAAFESVTKTPQDYLQNLYLKNQQDSALESLYLNKLAKPLIQLAQKAGVQGRKYAPTELYNELVKVTPYHEQKGEFPENPIQFGLRIDGLISSMGMAGIKIERVAPKNSIFLGLIAEQQEAA